MWYNVGWEISTWRMEHSSYLPKVILVATFDAFVSAYSCKNSAGLSFHRTPNANAQNLFQQRWMQHIHCAFSLLKDEFFICSNHFGKDLNETLRCGILYLFHCSDNP